MRGIDSFEWTRRKIGMIVLVSFVIAFLTISLLPVSFFIEIPQLRTTQAGTVYSHLFPEAPPVSYRFEAVFTATGIFSVNNPVHVKVTVKQVNVTNFLEYWCGVTLTHAYQYPTVYHEGFPMNSVIINVRDNGDGTYSGEKEIVWLEEGPTYLTEVINNPIGRYIPETMTENSTSVLTISSAADTLTLHFTQNTARLTWQIGSFSIIVLQPVFEAILLKKKPKE